MFGLWQVALNPDIAYPRDDLPRHSRVGALLSGENSGKVEQRVAALELMREFIVPLPQCPKETPRHSRAGGNSWRCICHETTRRLYHSRQTQGKALHRCDQQPEKTGAGTPDPAAWQFGQAG